MRKAFEQTISQSPYEKSIERWPDSPEHAWPLQYRDINVQMAWEMWVEAWNYAIQTAADACEKKAYSNKNSAFLGPELNSLDCAKTVIKLTIEP